MLGLEELLERRPSALSGGQRQRVAMGRAIVREPRAFLMDEPLSNLDAKLRVQMRAEIARIQRDLGVTTIYVTHDQTEAMTMSDRVAVFCNGKVEQVGTPLDVYNRPANRFVGEFIGDSNFFAGRIDAARPGLVELAGIGPVRVAQKTQAPVPAGDVDLMIRPERLRLRTDGESDGADNAFEMTVDDVINYGDSILAIGKTNGLPLRARIVGSEPATWTQGTKVKLFWAPADAHLLVRR